MHTNTLYRVAKPVHAPSLLLGLAILLGAGPLASAQTPACVQRGDLDLTYCDANRDLLADAPAKGLQPSKIVIAITATEDAGAARKTYSPLMDHLASCLKRDVEMYPPIKEGAVLEAQRNGTVHIGQYATGATMFAVNFAGAVPFAAKGKQAISRYDSYNLRLIVKADSPYRQPSDLKDKRIAHTSQSSNSGNLAPRALFPELGLRPDTDYKVEFSGSHEKSMVGVRLGLYDGAAVASDVLERLIAKGDMKATDFRTLYESDPFPPDVFTMSHNLDPKLQQQIRKCFSDFQFPDFVARQLEGNNRFYPVDYRKDWQIVRLIAKSAGRMPTAASYRELVTKR
jgi:phosphonate transport system substrate-binding protein